jgi:hypothetical protein
MNTFEEDLRATLREQEDALDGHTLARLGAARRAALATPVAPPWWRLHVPALGGAALAMAVAVVMLMPMQEQLRPPPHASEQLLKDPQFYEDLDFYMWLSESEMGNHG